MSELYELGKGLRGMGELLKGFSGAECPENEGAEGPQKGTATVGKAEGAYGKACEVTFPRPFSSVPVVVANAVWQPGVQGSDLPDTFAVTITQVKTTGFRANVYRVDHILAWTLENPKPAQGWSQELRLNWLASV